MERRPAGAVSGIQDLSASDFYVSLVFHSFGSFSLDYAHDSGVHSAEMFLQPAATGNSNCWSHQAWRRDWRTRTPLGLRLQIVSPYFVPA